MQRRNFIKTAGSILAAAPLLGSVAQAQSSTANHNQDSNVKEKHPGPNTPNDSQLDVHPGWVRSGRDNTPGPKAYYINLEAKPGKGDKVEQFLRDILAGVEKEPGTGPWFGCRFS